MGPRGPQKPGIPDIMTRLQVTVWERVAISKAWVSLVPRRSLVPLAEPIICISQTRRGTRYDQYVQSESEACCWRDVAP